MLVIVVIGTGCSTAGSSTPDEQVPVAAAVLGPAVSGGAGTDSDPLADPLAGLTAAASAFAPPTPSPAAGGSAAQGGASTGQTAGGAGAAKSIPGTDAAIQRWFLDNGAVKVRFNDALLRAWKAVDGGDATGCQPLDAGTRALSAALPALERLSPAGQELAATMRAPLTTFAAAATACLAKDFAAARIALDSGAVQQAEAQETVDEILDGDL
ncbi:MAG TPA: hypothetical protein VGX49_03885 [Jatrophihabitans sp.]|nr:hypothetical protein [Jatrophihabitans sp.]